MSYPTVYETASLAYGRSANHLFDLLVQAGGLGPTLTVFGVLRTLVILGAGAWLLFSPFSPESYFVWWFFLGFTGYSLLLYIVVLGRRIRDPTPRPLGLCY